MPSSNSQDTKTLTLAYWLKKRRLKVHYDIGKKKTLSKYDTTESHEVWLLSQTVCFSTVYSKVSVQGKIIFIVCYDFFSDYKQTKSLLQNNKPDIYFIKY